jgi:hypothetical protein
LTKEEKRLSIGFKTCLPSVPSRSAIYVMATPSEYVTKQLQSVHTEIAIAVPAIALGRPGLISKFNF